jgi:hypothetical protein
MLSFVRGPPIARPNLNAKGPAIMQRVRLWLPTVTLGFLIIVGWQLLTSGQQPAAEKNKLTGDRLDFEVVHSFDAKYPGDTPGHTGRVGGLSNRRPRVALGDTVYRGDKKIGSVTTLEWNRTNNSLDIEFDPVEDARIYIGDVVWLRIEPMPSAAGR